MAVFKTQILDQNSTSITSWHAPIVEGPITAKLNDSPPKPPTAREMQALQKEAYSEGFELGRKEGRNRGYQHGLKEGQDKLTEKILVLENLCNLLAHPLETLDDEMEMKSSPWYAKVWPSCRCRRESPASICIRKTRNWCAVHCHCVRSTMTGASRRTC